MKCISIEERAISLAHYIIDSKDTVRGAAKKFGISKSTVHKVVTLKNGKEKGQVIPESIEMLKGGYMAIIHVGPSEISPLSFSKHGHYLVISDIDENNNFYVINSNKIGDEQLGIPFDYDTILRNM